MVFESRSAPATQVSGKALAAGFSAGPEPVASAIPLRCLPSGPWWVPRADRNRGRHRSTRHAGWRARKASSAGALTELPRKSSSRSFGRCSSTSRAASVTDSF
jgi:hypothetical protein